MKKKSFNIYPCVAVVAVSQVAVSTAEKIVNTWSDNTSCVAMLYVSQKHMTSFNNVKRYHHFASQIRDIYKRQIPLIVIAANGIIIRCLASVLQEKRNAPPVIAVSVHGDYVVPLLGVHHGANDIAKNTALALKATLVHTSAGEDILGVALDNPPLGYILDSPEKAVCALSLANKDRMAQIDKNIFWLKDSALQHNSSALLCLSLSQDSRKTTDEFHLVYRAKTLCFGVGAIRNAEVEPFIEGIENYLKKHFYHRDCIVGFFSIDVKADEQAIHDLAHYFNCPVGFFNAQRLLLETEKLTEKSDIVFKEVGCYGVAEAAAYAATSGEGILIQSKQKLENIGTFACVESQKPIDFQTIPDLYLQGKLFVIGIGPGSVEWRSVECQHVLEQATDLVGYELYLSFLSEYHAGCTLHSFALGEEQKRVRHAISLAAQGKKVGLICSGDAGIYAMASLVFEELHKPKHLPDNADRIDVHIVPGISAMQAAAAKAGAPLGHDFCVISLSDLLTPTRLIKKRIDMALEADFVIALYNPVSQKRKELLAYTLLQTEKKRGGHCAMVIARQLGRREENIVCCQLTDIDKYVIDMLTLVIIGNSQSQLISSSCNKSYVYTPRGYEVKTQKEQ